MTYVIQEHNQKPASVWSSGGDRYQEVSRTIADSIEHCVLRFEKGVSYYREPSGLAAWVTFVNGYGPTKSLAAILDTARRAELERDFAAFHDGFPTKLGICVPREYWLTVGRRW